MGVVNTPGLFVQGEMTVQPEANKAKMTNDCGGHCPPRERECRPRPLLGGSRSFHRSMVPTPGRAYLGNSPVFRTKTTYKSRLLRFLANLLT
ncbi:hypothetical protein RRG08_011161 [Elysia crispata]|uniref:Uncharacterized protein n=1 Tax=Elysia crispata TaxID=231223 RepID=A0AAE1A0M8_9GAST|nr:hypothetical protein RRG08_011161 [Elysia crispata]